MRSMRRQAALYCRISHKGSDEQKRNSDFNVFNFLQLSDGVDSEMQVMYFYHEVTYFKMQVMLLRLALLAFFPIIQIFFSIIRPGLPINRGKPQWSAPSANAKIQHFSFESKKC